LLRYKYQFGRTNCHPSKCRLQNCRHQMSYHLLIYPNLGITLHRRWAHYVLLLLAVRKGKQSRHFGNQNFGSWHFGSWHFGSRYAAKSWPSLGFSSRKRFESVFFPWFFLTKAITSIFRCLL
jgi:hypothetical protein